MKINRWISVLLDPLGLLPAEHRVMRRFFYALDRLLVAKKDNLSHESMEYDISIPPPSLLYSISGYFNVDWYCKSGKECFCYMKRYLEELGIDIEKLESVLDFGCGCGRVIQHLRFPSRLVGVDTNKLAIEWCKDNISFAEFYHIHPFSTLPFDNETFDFIYAISVFTHLTEELEKFWFEEIYRVLRYGGILLLTIRIEPSYLHPFTRKERKIFSEKGFVSLHPRYAGTLYCNSFHSLEYIQKTLLSKFKLRSLIRKGATDYKQDIVILEK